MSYVLGYDQEDYRSDDENTTQPQPPPWRRRINDKRMVNRFPTAEEMDRMDTMTLTKYGWMEPLGYRALSEISGLPPKQLRRHFWASKLRRSSPEYADISYYFTNSHSHAHGVQMRIKRVVNLKRFKENNCDYKDPNVQLLWHGTSVSNVASILTNGFKLPMRNGMFGRGVYFADRVSKSAQYCGDNNSQLKGTSNVLFLCAVNLGRMFRSRTGMNSLTAPPKGYDSVKGCGQNVPDRTCVRYHRGARIPCGKTFKRSEGGLGLIHNEYIVYDLSKIAILFLVEFEYC